MAPAVVITKPHIGLEKRARQDATPTRYFTPDHKKAQIIFPINMLRI
jgi:hypothetical protein